MSAHKKPTIMKASDKQFRNRRVKQIESLCEKFNIPAHKHFAQTGTVYFTFEINNESVKYRIADHADAYGTANYNSDPYECDDYFQFKKELIKEYKPIFEDAQKEMREIEQAHDLKIKSAHEKNMQDPLYRLAQRYQKESNYDLVQVANLLRRFKNEENSDESVISFILNDEHDYRDEAAISLLIETVNQDLNNA